MATYEDIVPNNDEQLLICGQKGSGKTTLIKRIIALLPDELIIIIDSKPDWENLVAMFSLSEKPKKLQMKFLWTLCTKEAKGVYVYQTDAEKPAYDDKNVDKIIFWSLRRYNRLKNKKGMTIIIDELGDFAKGSYTTASMSKLIRQGRSKKIRIILGSQRPSGIPQIAIDQAQRVCVFMLMNKNDRKRMSDWIHPGLIKMATGRNFWYYQIPRDRPAIPLILMRQRTKDARYLDNVTK